MTSPAEPRLAPPGAGLPLPERLLAHFFFRLRVRTGTPAEFTARFVEERRKIAELIRGVDAARGGRRVLIERLRGLEDSSRYWSVAMTLDHLRIVNSEIARLITSLAAGQVPPGRASTAAVKPDPTVSMTVLPAYEATCDDLLAAVAHPENFSPQVKFPHPWFGLMDAKAWHALSGIHMGIHRVQIKRILAGMTQA